MPVEPKALFGGVHAQLPTAPPPVEVTLRDWFAAQAMLRAPIARYPDGTNNFESAAVACYLWADAMLKVRSI